MAVFEITDSDLEVAKEIRRLMRGDVPLTSDHYEGAGLLWMIMHDHKTLQTGWEISTYSRLCREYLTRLPAHLAVGISLRGLGPDERTEA